MTRDQAIAIAEGKALELHIPWSREAITAKHRRVWPFAGGWWIIARVKSERAIVTIGVSERTGRAMPKRVVYPAGGLV